MEEYAFGQRIVVESKLKRVRLGYGRNTEKIWISVETEIKEVIVIGIRTLSNGINYYSDGGTFYEPREFFKAALVVESLSRNPFYIKI